MDAAGQAHQLGPARQQLKNRVVVNVSHAFALSELDKLWTVGYTSLERLQSKGLEHVCMAYGVIDD
ncbi:hypothetical protein GPECTOR_58g579 [Gonium pectorale]|uniref:Uncharacterized protein n=1 Tax=Gonium pectorale TaxID=33097 RepID=A0A150G714_GONPE|nr:hypothetical protein GPECTOR_58g579 [Gonium pectorale]|eukprot:KXZ45130.1 hypothetical protein GPECTOR_58g579 [Gonium pectorale]